MLSSASSISNETVLESDPVIEQPCCRLLYTVSPKDCNAIVLVIVIVEIIFGIVATAIAGSVDESLILSFSVGAIGCVAVTLLVFYIFKRAQERIAEGEGCYVHAQVEDEAPRV